MALRDFTDEDMRKIQNLLDQESRRVNGSYRPEDPSYIDKSPDVHIAKTPSGGIPKRQSLRLGKKSCKIYELVPVTFGSTIVDLSLMSNPDGTDYELLVYNTSSAKITAEFVIIRREKTKGYWVVDCPCGTDPSSSSSSESSSSSSSSESSSSSSESSSSLSSSSDPSSSSEGSSISESSSYYDSSSSSDDYDDPPNGPCICTYSECCYEDGWGNNLFHNTNPPCGEGYTSVTTWRCYAGGGGDWCTISGLCTYNLAPGGFEGETRGTPHPCCD